MDPFFGAVGIRFDAHCPKCGSRERHRFLKLWMDQDRRGHSFTDVLHFAPEAELIDILRRRSTSYRTADLSPGVADLQLNIEAIDLPDQSVDTVIANHVLEHVDHRKALAEVRRVLRPGGLAILTTPVVHTWDESYEDPTKRGPAEQFRHFGQQDHVRYFGRDLETDIRDAGFDLECVVADGAQAAQYALVRGDTIYLAQRPSE